MNIFKLMASLGLDTSAYDSALGGAESKAGRFGSALKRGVGTALKATGAALAAASTAVVGFAKSSVDAGMQFDSSMSQVAATMGVTVGEIQDLRKFALDMGATTAFSASQAADALNYMALAGYDAETSMQMLPNVLNLAAAGNIELATASDMVTDAQSALGLSLDETNAMVDQMAKASSKTNTSVAQLGEAILTVGGTAQYMAGGTKELTAVLGVLADNGIKGAEGGTHLRNMLLSLSKPSDDAVALLQTLGVSIFDAEGNMRSFADIFPELNAAMANMTDQQRLDAMSTLFNTRDIAAATALLSTTTDRWNELGDAIGGAAGAAQQMANTQLDNLAGDVTLFKSALEGAKIAVSDELTPTLRDFVQFGTDGVGQIAAAFSEGGLTKAMGALGDFIGKAVVKITAMVPTIVKAAGQLLTGFVDGIVDNADSIIDAAVSVIDVLIDAFSDNFPRVLGSFGEIVIKLASAIIANLPKLLSAISKAFVTIVKTIGDSLPTLIPVVVQGIVEMAQVILDNVPELLSAVLETVGALAQGLLDALPVLLDALPGIIMGIVEFMTGDALPQLLDMVLQLVQGLADGILEALPVIIEALPVIIAGIIEFLLDAIPQLVQAGVDLLTSLVDALPTIVNSIVAAIPQIINGILDAIIGAIPQLMQAGIDLLVALIQALPTIITTIVGAIPEIIGGILGALTDHLDDIIMAGVQLFVALIENLPTIIVEIVKAVPQIVSGIVSAFGSLVGKLVEVGGNLIRGLWNGINDAAGWVLEKIKGFGKKILDGIKNFFGIHSPSRLFHDVIGKNLMLGLGEGIEDYSDSAVNPMLDVADRLTEAAQIGGIPYRMRYDVANDGDMGINDGSTIGGRWTLNVYAPKMTPSEAMEAAVAAVETQQFLGLA